MFVPNKPFGLRSFVRGTRKLYSNSPIGTMLGHSAVNGIAVVPAVPAQRKSFASLITLPRKFAGLFG